MLGSSDFIPFKDSQATFCFSQTSRHHIYSDTLANEENSFRNHIR